MPRQVFYGEPPAYSPQPMPTELHAGAGTLIRSRRSYAVALQEADGLSVWSGRFDHVAAVARAAGLPLQPR